MQIFRITWGVGIALRLLGEAGVLQENFGQAGRTPDSAHRQGLYQYTDIQCIYHIDIIYMYNRGYMYQYIWHMYVYVLYIYTHIYIFIHTINKNNKTLIHLGRQSSLPLLLMTSCPWRGPETEIRSSLLPLPACVLVESQRVSGLVQHPVFFGWRVAHLANSTRVTWVARRQNWAVSEVWFCPSGCEPRRRHRSHAHRNGDSVHV